MDNLTQKDPVWRENGKAFVESVTRLLERLLDYRNVGQVREISRHDFFYSRKKVLEIHYVICHPFDSVMHTSSPMTHVVMHDTFHARNMSGRQKHSGQALLNVVWQRMQCSVVSLHYDT